MSSYGRGRDGPASTLCGEFLNGLMRIYKVGKVDDPLTLSS